MIEWLAFWSGVIAVVATAVAALAGSISWYFSNKVTSVKEEELERFKIDSTKRTAELTKEAEQARLEAEKIKASVSWRVIPLDKASIFEKFLSERPGSVNIQFINGDVEAFFFAYQFIQIFNKAKWKVSTGSTDSSNSIAFGIELPNDDSVDAQTLRNAFRIANISFSTDKPPRGNIGFGATIENAPILFIGSKKPILP